jgi:hypothetical protein
VLFTGGRYIMIVARNAEEELQIGRRLRRLDGQWRRHLPPPRRAIKRQVYDACG